MTAILLLTKNEENTIGQLIDNLKFCLKQIPGLNAKLFLCDDSTDQTAEIAKKKGVAILKGKGQGLGWSYYFALYFLSKHNFKNIITIDGDGQTDLSELTLFYKELKKGYDLIVGSRFLKKDSISYAYSTSNFVGVRILSFILTIATFQKFTDSHGGLRIMRSSVAKHLKFLGTHSYVQETIITAKEQGFKIKEIPSQWNKRVYGESRVVQSKFKYMKAMALPLLLRMRIHYLFASIGLALLIILKEPFYVWLIILSALAELYKIWTFKKNYQQTKELADNG